MAALKAADTITPLGVGRKQGFCAALAIAKRWKGADRLALLEECGLLAYESVKLKARVSNDLIKNYRRPGQ